MNFFPHHISTPSKPPNIDFPKIVDFTNKEISWKWCSNSEMIEKTWLLQESITHPTAGFEVFVNKKPTFNCSINDAGTTISGDVDMRKKKQQIFYSLPSSKTSLLRTSDSISKKIIDWHQTILIKSIGKKQCFCVKEPFVYNTFESTCPKNTQKVPQITSFYN